MVISPIPSLCIFKGQQGRENEAMLECRKNNGECTWSETGQWDQVCSWRLWPQIWHELPLGWFLSEKGEDLISRLSEWLWLLYWVEKCEDKNVTNKKGLSLFHPFYDLPIFIFVYVCFVCIDFVLYVCTTRMLQLELEIVVSLHVGAMNWTGVFFKNSKCS